MIFHLLGWLLLSDVSELYNFKAISRKIRPNLRLNLYLLRDISFRSNVTSVEPHSSVNVWQCLSCADVTIISGPDCSSLSCWNKFIEINWDLCESNALIYFIKWENERALEWKFSLSLLLHCGCSLKLNDGLKRNLVPKKSTLKTVMRIWFYVYFIFGWMINAGNFINVTSGIWRSHLNSSGRTGFWDLLSF